MPASGSPRKSQCQIVDRASSKNIQPAVRPGKCSGLSKVAHSRSGRKRQVTALPSSRAQTRCGKGRVGHVTRLCGQPFRQGASLIRVDAKGGTVMAMQGGIRDLAPIRAMNGRPDHRRAAGRRWHRRAWPASGKRVVAAISSALHRSPDNARLSRAESRAQQARGPARETGDLSGQVQPVPRATSRDPPRSGERDRHLIPASDSA